MQDEGFMPCQLSGEDERLASIALGLRSLDGIQDVHHAARDLHHHEGMGRWRMAEQVTLDTDNRVVAAPQRLTEVIETSILVEGRARTDVDEACMGSGERDVETGTPSYRADLPFHPHRAHTRQHYVRNRAFRYGGALSGPTG